MENSEIQSDDEWQYPKPRFKYWWVCWTAFVLIVFYIGYGFVLTGEATWFELILFVIAMIIYPGTSCYKVRKVPDGEVPTYRADTDIETSRARHNLED